MQLYHETACSKGFDTCVAELLDIHRRLNVYQYAVQMEGQKIWIPERLLLGAGGTGGHGSPTKRKRPAPEDGSPTKAHGTPSPTTEILKLLQHDKRTTPLTLLKTPTGESTPGESPPAESMEPHAFAAQRKLVFPTQSQVRTFTQQTQDDKHPGLSNC